MSWWVKDSCVEARVIDFSQLVVASKNLGGVPCNVIIPGPSKGCQMDGKGCH